MKKKWLDKVIEAFKKMGGIVSYSEIYNYIEKNTDRKLPDSWKAIVRKIIEDHSSDSNNFKSSDLFYSVEGIGKGIWGLREILIRTPKAEDSGEIEDKTDMPERVKVEIYRVLRDTNLTIKMKQLYKNKCQICGGRIKLKDGKDYSEAHHIKPLGKHKGPDSADNIIILCPNHHVEFDYGVIAIKHDTLTIIHKDYKNPYFGKKLIINSKHKLKSEYLRYHLKEIYGCDEK